MRILRILCCLSILLTGLLVVYQPATALAQDEDATEPKIELTADYTKLEATSGESFEFEVKLKYEGDEARIFDLEATGPQGWTLYITPSYPKDKRIKDIRLEGFVPETVLIYAAPPYWLLPEPGEYAITLKAASETITDTIEVTAVITARYALSLLPATERYSTTVKAGKDNFFSIELQNGGSAAIENISFSSTKPEGWTIDFTPEKVDSLEAVQTQTIDVTIKPEAKTIAGDYNVTFRASGKEASADALNVRVTVETPIIWGWTGVGIIILVIAGLAFIILRFGRR